MSEPTTEAGRALSVRRAHQNGVNLMDKAAMAFVDHDIRAIEAEAREALRAELIAKVADIQRYTPLYDVLEVHGYLELDPEGEALLYRDVVYLLTEDEA